MLRMIVVSALLFGSVSAVPLFAAAEKAAKEIVLKQPDFSKGKTVLQALKERKSSRNFSDKQLDLQTLSELVWAAGGINRPDGRRTFPTAMNSLEIDIYAFMKDGVYYYDAAANKLVLIAEGDKRALTGTQAFVANAAVNFVYVSDLAKMRGGDTERNRMMTAVATGHIGQNVYLYSASAGLSCVVRALSAGDELRKLLKLTDTQIIMMSQSVGYGE